MTAEELAIKYKHLISPRNIGVTAYNDGWTVLVEQCFQALEDLDRQGIKAKTVQVKEKLGSLRFYFDVLTKNLTDEQEELCRKAFAKIYEIEALCGSTCEICGEGGKIRNLSGYFTSRCDAHSKKRDY